MDYLRVDASNVATLYELNIQLAADENQRSLFTANKENYFEAFLGRHPACFGYLCMIGDEPVGFYIYFFKFASYLGLTVLHLEDIYLTSKHRSHNNVLDLLNHAVQVSVDELCCRVEMRVLKSFNLGYDPIEACGFQPVEKWDIYRLE